MINGSQYKPDPRVESTKRQRNIYSCSAVCLIASVMTRLGQQYHSAMSSCTLDIPPMIIRECMRVQNVHYVLQEQSFQEAGEGMQQYHITKTWKQIITG